MDPGYHEPNIVPCVGTAQNFFGLGEEVCLHSLLVRLVSGHSEFNIRPQRQCVKESYLTRLHNVGTTSRTYPHGAPQCLV